MLDTSVVFSKEVVFSEDVISPSSPVNTLLMLLVSMRGLVVTGVLSVEMYGIPESVLASVGCSVVMRPRLFVDISVFAPTVVSQCDVLYVFGPILDAIHVMVVCFLVGKLV